MKRSHESFGSFAEPIFFLQKILWRQISSEVYTVYFCIKHWALGRYLSSLGGKKTTFHHFHGWKIDGNL